MAQPQDHWLPFDGTTRQPSAGSYDLDPQLQSLDAELWAGWHLQHSRQSGLGAPSVGHIGFPPPSVGYDSLNIHGYSDHNVLASQPAQWPEFTYWANDHVAHAAGITPTLWNNYDDFTGPAIYNYDGLFSPNELSGRLPAAEVRQMVMPAPQGHDQLLGPFPSRAFGGPVDYAYSPTAATTPSLWGSGEVPHIAMRPGYELPMYEASSNSVLAGSQTVAEAPLNALGGLHPLMTFDRFEGPRDGWNSRMNAVETTRTHHSDNLVTLSPVVSAGASLPTVRKEKAEEQIVCQVCPYEAKSDGDLERHAMMQGHDIIKCPYDECDGAFDNLRTLRKHLSETHVSDHDEHGPVRSGPGHTCDECKQGFSSAYNLSRHATEQRHTPFACKCTKKFSRADVLMRHLLKYQLWRQPTYPCTHCKRHTGDKGFKRKEHLIQHLRNYHHIDVEKSYKYCTSYIPLKYRVCSHLDCPQYRAPEVDNASWREKIKSRPFTGQAQHMKHMREEHDESMFPCDVPHCDRVGGKGYCREMDLVRHRRAKHPDAIPYVPTPC